MCSRLIEKRNIVLVFSAGITLMLLVFFMHERYLYNDLDRNNFMEINPHHDEYDSPLEAFSTPSPKSTPVLKEETIFQNVFNISNRSSAEIRYDKSKTVHMGNQKLSIGSFTNSKTNHTDSRKVDHRILKVPNKSSAKVGRDNSKIDHTSNQNMFGKTSTITTDPSSDVGRDMLKSLPTDKHNLFRNIFNISNQPSVGIGLDNKTDKNNYLIYRCDEQTITRCGGLIDRIKGIGAAYLIANLTGRTFKLEILMKSCDFHRYLIPNHVDWHLPVSFHESVVPSADVSLLSKINDVAFLKNPNLDFLSMPQMQNRFVYHRGNTEFYMTFKSLRRYQKQLSWIQHLTYSQIVNAIFRRLFRPSPHIQEKTKKFFNQNLLPHEKLVCAHLRTGINPSNPNDTPFYKFTSFGFRNTWDFFQRMTRGNDSKIFLMSDSEDVIRRAKAMPFGNKIFSSPGRMVHIDRSSTDVPADVKCKGLEKIIFEHYILLHCDVLLISRSGIGIHAASVRNTDKGLYCLRISGDLQPCKRNDFIDLYKLYPVI